MKAGPSEPSVDLVEESELPTNLKIFLQVIKGLDGKERWMKNNSKKLCLRGTGNIYNSCYTLCLS